MSDAKPPLDVILLFLREQGTLIDNRGLTQPTNHRAVTPPGLGLQTSD
jgi:hypothetical protein